MENIDRFKSAWQQQPVEGHSLSSPVHVSRSIQFLRTSAIRDLQRSEELSRLIFSLLFALVAVGVSFLVAAPGAARIAAWLFAAALFVDGATGMALLLRRLGAPTTTTVLEFISREHRQLESQIRFERYSQRFMVILAAVALVLLFLAPHPINIRESALDALVRMAILTAFLAFAWRRMDVCLVQPSDSLHALLVAGESRKLQNAGFHSHKNLFFINVRHYHDWATSFSGI